MFPTLGNADDDINEFVVSDNEPANEMHKNCTSQPKTNLFVSPTLLSVWKAVRTRENRVSAAVLLPSGVCDTPGGISLEIEDEKILKVTVRWPRVFMDVDVLLKQFLEGGEVTKIDRSHPMIGGFEDALRTYQKETDKDIESTTRVELPFSVLPNPPRYLCVYEDTSTAVLIVTMESPRAAFSESNEIPVLYARKTPLNPVSGSSEPQP